MAYATEWDLSELLPSLAPDDVDPALDDLEAKLRRLEKRRGDLDAIEDPGELAEVLDELAEVERRANVLRYRASLAFSVDTEDEQAQAFLARMEDRAAEIDNRTRFVEHWIKQLPDDRAEALVPDDPDLAYYVRRLRAFAPHTLSEAEERVVSLKDVSGASALVRTRDMLESGLTFEDPRTGEQVTRDELLTGTRHHDPGIRRATYEELWSVWSDHAPVMAHLYRSVVQDWHNEMVELRGHEAPIDRRHMLNDVPPEAVETLLDVCRDRRELFQDVFLWKGDELGIEMDRTQIYAPLRTTEEPEIGFESAASTVLDVLEGFDTEVADQARRVFEERHVDAFPRPGKRGGAYCATPSNRHTPYLFLNHTDDRASLKTLAHEMGHAIHAMQADDRHELVHQPGLALAETASVFGEMLTHDHLVERADEAEARELICDKLTEIYQTVQRQAYFARFEIAAHPELREGATVGEVHELYMENLEEQFGPIEVPDPFRFEWTYIPHFVHTPFYVYAYSFGMLLSLALYDLYRSEGDEVVGQVKEILAAGGARKPRKLLLDVVGMDVTDRGFWERGFGIVESMVDELGAR